MIPPHMEQRRNVGSIVVVLVLVIVLLLGVILYSFFIKPKVNAYVVSKQTEAQDVVVNYILTQVQQQGFVQINDFRNNQTITLVPYTGPKK
jgi:multisubunit Na+/H+ antiporter MnhB subunit